MTLLNVVLLAIRPSSLFSESTSDCRSAFALVSRTPLLPDWTVRSRMRWRMDCVSVSAPSAVWTTDVPSWALRTATVRPPICDFRPSLMARPAASSAARLMRKPDDSFSSELPTALLDDMTLR